MAFGVETGGMNRKMKLLVVSIAVMIAVSGMGAYTVIAINNTPHPIRVACIGDSITQGSGYPNKLQTLLGSHYTVKNFGVSGSTVSLNSSKPYMNQTAFKKAEDFRPQIVVIMLGTNDANSQIAHSKDNFEANYKQLIKSFEDLEGDQAIWVVKSPPIFTDNPSYNNTYLAENILPQIDNVATQMDLPAVDMYKAFGNHSDYFMDGIHPNADGATLIASNVYEAITLNDNSPGETPILGP
jgi:acyl-CoA thioesterase I